MVNEEATQRSGRLVSKEADWVWRTEPRIQMLLVIEIDTARWEIDSTWIGHWAIMIADHEDDELDLGAQIFTCRFMVWILFLLKPFGEVTYTDRLPTYL